MKIDISQIPEETGKRFGQCIIDGLREYLKQPGAREALEERTKARKARNTPDVPPHRASAPYHVSNSNRFMPLETGVALPPVAAGCAALATVAPTVEMAGIDGVRLLFMFFMIRASVVTWNAARDMRVAVLVEG